MIDTSGQTLTVFTASYYTHTHTHTRGQSDRIWTVCDVQYMKHMSTLWLLSDLLPVLWTPANYCERPRGTTGWSSPSSSFCPSLPFLRSSVLPSLSVFALQSVYVCLSVCRSVCLALFLAIFILSLYVCVCESLPLCVRLISQWAVCHTLTLTFSRAPAQIFTL